MRSLRRALPWAALFSITLHGAWLVLAPGGGWAEAWATSIYPTAARVIGFLPDLVPFSVTLALAGALVVAALASLVGLVVAWRRRRLGATTRRLAGAWIVVLAIVFHGFFVTWGYHYLRAPLPERAGWGPVDPDAVAAFRRRAVATTNATWVPVGDWDPDDLATRVRRAVDRAARRLGDGGLPVRHRLKPPLPPALLATIGTYGFISPWLLEAHVDLRLPPPMRAFTAAHEQAHLAGYAPEGDANFVAWLALTTDEDPRLRYAGHLGVLPYAVTAATARAIAPRVRDDLAALRAYRRATVSRGIERGAKAAYRVYLKANRVEGGLASYGTVVGLIARYERSRTRTRSTRR